MAKLPLRLLENAIFFASGDHAAWSSCEPEVPGVRSTDEPSGATRKTSQLPPASLTLAVMRPRAGRQDDHFDMFVDICGGGLGAGIGYDGADFLTSPELGLMQISYGQR